MQKQQDRSGASSVATSSSVSAAEDKVKKLKRRNAELVANARLLEKSLRSLQQQQQRRQQVKIALDLIEKTCLAAEIRPNIGKA